MHFGASEGLNPFTSQPDEGAGPLSESSLRARSKG